MTNKCGISLCERTAAGWVLDDKAELRLCVEHQRWFDGAVQERASRIASEMRQPVCILSSCERAATKLIKDINAPNGEAWLCAEHAWNVENASAVAPLEPELLIEARRRADHFERSYDKARHERDAAQLVLDEERAAHAKLVEGLRAGHQQAIEIAASEAHRAMHIADNYGRLLDDYHHICAELRAERRKAKR